MSKEANNSWQTSSVWIWWVIDVNVEIAVNNDWTGMHVQRFQNVGQLVEEGGRSLWINCRSTWRRNYSCHPWTDMYGVPQMISESVTIQLQTGLYCMLQWSHVNYFVSVICSSTRLELWALAVFAVLGWDVWHKWWLWATQTLVHWWPTYLHQCSGHWCTSCNAASHSLYWTHWTMDGQKLALSKPGQNTDHLGRFTSAVGQSECCRISTAVVRFRGVSDFGFMVDLQLNVSDHVSRVCHSCYF